MHDILPKNGPTPQSPPRCLASCHAYCYRYSLCRISFRRETDWSEILGYDYFATIGRPHFSIRITVHRISENFDGIACSEENGEYDCVTFIDRCPNISANVQSDAVNSFKSGVSAKEVFQAKSICS